MADNATVDNGGLTDIPVATDKVTYSGDADQNVQLVRVVGVTGAEGSKTVTLPRSPVGMVMGGADGYSNAFVLESFANDGSGNDELGIAAIAPMVFNGTTWDRLRGNTSGLFAQGNVAHDSVDSGNPVKIGGKHVSVPTPVADGDRVNAWFDQYGRLNVASSGETYILGSVSGENAEVTGTGSSAALNVGGNVAHDIADAGNPIKIGGKANSGFPTDVANGDRVDAWMTRAGALNVVGAEWVSSGDGKSDGDTLGVRASDSAGYPLGTRPYVFNGTTWDRLRGNTDGLFVARDKNLITEVTGNGTALNQTPIASTDCTHTPFVAVQLTGTWVGTVEFEVSNDGTNWVTTYLSRVSQGPLTAVATANDIYAGPVHAKFFRARVSAYTSGTIVARAEFFSRVAQYTDTDVRIVLAQSYAGGVAAGADAQADTVIETYNDTGGSQARLAMVPYVFNGTTWDRLRSLPAFDTAAASPRTGLLAAQAPDHRYTSVSLGTAANSTQSWESNGADETLIRVGTTTTGTMTFEVTADGTNWLQASTRDTQTGLWASAAFTPTSGKTYRVMTAGWRSVRARTVTTLGATVALIATAHADATILNAIDTGPAPHAFGYTPWFAGADITTATTTNIKTPTSGRRLVITKVTLGTGSTTAGLVTVWLAASGDTTVNLNTDDVIFRGVLTPTANATPGLVLDFPNNPPVGTADYLLKVTTGAAITLYVTARGYEIA